VKWARHPPELCADLAALALKPQCERGELAALARRHGRSHNSLSATLCYLRRGWRRRPGAAVPPRQASA